MLKGLLQVLDAAQMDSIHGAILRVLEEQGLMIRGEFLLKALADAGCRVDMAHQRAWFKPELVERQIARQRNRYKGVRSSLWHPFAEMTPDDAAVPEEFCVDFGFAAPWKYDYPSGEYRRPSAQDQIDMVRLGQALPEAKAVNAPYICAEFDQRVETIESARLLLLNTTKPGWVGTSCGVEVKYLAELSALALGRNTRQFRTAPPIVVNAYCTTSPLKIDTRSCDVLREALKYRFPVNFASMPILGATTPVTPAGSVIVAAAEILGGIAAASLIDPEVYYYGTSIAGEMDMRTTQVCYATPAAILTDAALHQLFRRRYGLVLNVESAYVEAKCPGMQAAFMKTFRQMGFAATASSSLPIGLLDNGAVFSPTQAMIDLDLNKAMHGLSRGMAVDAESMAVDVIKEIGFAETASYIQSEHTLERFRDVLWNSRFMDRTYRREESLKPQAHDAAILAAADQAWRDRLAASDPWEPPRALAQEVDRVVTAARAELLGPSERP